MQMLRKIRVAVAAIAIASLPILAGATVNHTVKRGETIYGISKSYGISIDELLRYNPSARDGLKTGEVLVLPGEGDASTDQKAEPSAKELAAAKKKTYHTIAKGQTLFSIAKSYGMTLDELLALNPSIDSADYKPGMVLRLTSRTACPAAVKPLTKNDNASSRADEKTERNHASEPEKEVMADPEVVEAEVEIAADETDTMSIALILPFMLDEQHESKQAQLFTDFYKGFMLAADTLSHRGAPVKIYAFDSADCLDSVTAIMENRLVVNSTVIVAPDDQEQLKYVATKAKERGTYVYNAFVTKDDTHADNSYVIQSNVPHDAMYAHAIKSFITRFEGYTPVFITHKDGKNEKGEFTRDLKAALAEKGVEYKEIEYANYLSASDLDGLSAETKYVFVPASGMRSDFHKFASALKTFKAEDADAERVRVFGYPEWTAFRNDAFDMLCELNAVIYSRFYNDQSAYKSRNLNSRFRRWFGSEMIDAVPSQGALGYDTGYFLIKALRDNRGDLSRRISPYEGVQSVFDFTAEGTEGVGRVNDALYFVYFRPGGFVEKVQL